MVLQVYLKRDLAVNLCHTNLCHMHPSDSEPVTLHLAGDTVPPAPGLG